MLELIHTPLIVVHVIVCIFLCLVVLLQPGKGGGLGGALGGGGAAQVFGGRGAGTVLTKATWTAATIFFLSSTTLAYLSSSVDDSLAERSPQAAPAEESGEDDATQ